MSTSTELKPLLKRLKLGQMLNTLPGRLALARRDQLDHAAFLQILLADEVSRRDQRHLYDQLQKVGFEDICRLEDSQVSISSIGWLRQQKSTRDWTCQSELTRRVRSTAAHFAMSPLNIKTYCSVVGVANRRRKKG